MAVVKGSVLKNMSAGFIFCRQRDELEDQLRHISMERERIKKSMVWCLDHSDSAEEVSMYIHTYMFLLSAFQHDLCTPEEIFILSKDIHT